MVQTRGQEKAAARAERRKRKEMSTPSHRHALESTTQKRAESSRQSPPCAPLYSPRSASDVVYSRCFKMPSTKEFARFRPALERIGLGGLTYYPWRVRSNSMLEELRQVNFAGTAKKKEHRAQFFQWDETVFAEVYGLQASGSGTIERNNELIKRFFPCKSAVMGWLPCQCQDPDLRLVFEFITPIFSSARPPRISVRTAATVTKAWVEPGSTNWAAIFRDRFRKYAAATVGGKCSYVSPFLLHIYYFNGLLTPEEQAAWTCDPLEVARDASNATTAMKTAPRPDRAADIRGSETRDLSAGDTVRGTEGEGEMDGVHLRSPAPNTSVEIDTAADTDMQSPEDGNASAHETLNTSAAAKAKERDDNTDFAAERTACEGGQVSPEILIDVPISIDSPSRILEEGGETAAPARAEREGGGEKEFEAEPSSGRTVLTHRSHGYEGPDPVRTRSVDRQVGNDMPINCNTRKRRTLHANSFLGIQSDEILLADEVCKEFGCEAEGALETFRALTQTRAWRDTLSNIRRNQSR